MISPAMVTVEPPLLHPPVNRTYAIPSEILRFAKPVAVDSSARSPLEYSVGVGPAKIRSITPVAGVSGCTGRATGVKNGSVLARKRFWLTATPA